MNYVEYVSQRKARGLCYVSEYTWNCTMGCGDYEPDPRIRPYLDALLHDSPYVSASCYVLAEAQSKHGVVTITGLLAEHWIAIAEQRSIGFLEELSAKSDMYRFLTGVGQ